MTLSAMAIPCWMDNRAASRAIARSRSINSALLHHGNGPQGIVLASLLADAFEHFEQRQ